MKTLTNSLKQLFDIIKWIKKTKKEIISQAIILSLKKRMKEKDWNYV